MNNLEHPAISILMPVYNESKYIVEAIRSVLANKVHNFELLVVDDGSTDGTAEVIRHGFQDARIRVLSPGKVGKAAAFNLAFAQSRADWIIYLAGDDTLTEEGLSARLEAFVGCRPTEEKLVCYGRLITMSIEPRFDGIVIPKDPRQGNRSGGTLMLSRALAIDVFPIPDILPNEDTWTALHADHLAMKPRMIPKIVLNYRIHSGNSMARTEGFDTMTQKRHQRFIAYELFLRKVEDRLPEQGRRLLQALAKGEELRFGRHPWRLLVHSALPLKERLRMMAYASPSIYWLRMRFYGLFSGW